MKHKSPVRHTVKSHKREGKLVREHQRGSGTKVSKTKPAFEFKIPKDWERTKTQMYGGTENYVKWLGFSHEDGCLVVQIVQEDDSMMWNGQHNYEVHSFIDNMGDGEDLDVAEYHGGGATLAEARKVAQKAMRTVH